MTDEFRNDIATYCAERKETIVASFRQLCAIPGVSADPGRRADIRKTAAWITAQALDAGFHSARAVETDGNPVVVAEYRAGDDRPTVLVYAHYDVQPANDPERWTSPPFEPTVRDGAVWARGATDDKGHVIMHLTAVRALLDLTGSVPVNVRLVVEGEEEIGSPHFDAFLRDHPEVLDADAWIVSDTPGFIGDHPTVCTGVRGLVLADITLTASDAEPHSGLFGGAVRNPAEALAALLAGLKDPATGRVLLDGFYDRVTEPTQQERAALAALPFDEDAWLAGVGARAVHGESGWTTLERVWWRPTLEVNAIASGDAVAEVKTVVPVAARARVSCRLVPDQSAVEIARSLRSALEAVVPPGLTADVRVRTAGDPVAIGSDHPLVGAASRAVATVLGTAPVPVRMGGSIPPLASLVADGMPGLLVGVGKDSDNFHAVDEHLSVDRLLHGTALMAQLWREFAVLPAAAYARTPAAPGVPTPRTDAARDTTLPGADAASGPRHPSAPPSEVPDAG
ncbi:M20/M25/M40 family metallo-hydrolase [Streptomyces sp. AgN23]|uniref:M20/M25/M40 family metallo-hydrolase n=1 Tax=Streptomyces sp. AgN23 TaxID=1188315 RepID=UPI001B320A0B|nr:M20/M25/M40 family metallo-hydrolase [Streptomyces sp. AgN23]QTI87277.1 M20/M25/M40 family metallo-hydrolase [Streptomyces sp. AgN23]